MTAELTALATLPTPISSQAACGSRRRVGGRQSGALGRCDRARTAIDEVSFPSQPRKARSRMLRKHA